MLRPPTPEVDLGVHEGHDEDRVGGHDHRQAHDGETDGLPTTPVAEGSEDLVEIHNFRLFCACNILYMQSASWSGNFLNKRQWAYGLACNRAMNQ